MDNPTAIDIDQQPGHAIRRLHQISVGIFLQEVGELGVTPVQYAALQVVGNQPGTDQRTLARTIALDASTTGGVVDRLEARGWLERRLSPEDRRARQLFLTPAGEQALADTVPAMLRTQDQILAPLTPRQRTEFMRLLQLLVTQNNDLSRAPSERAARNTPATG
ncbi:MAG: MarR family transcriptional regulator [Comamonadaceae bacterium]|nr:MarR family transcriptional regulator [Comamonadaceae bacterium]